MPTYLRGFLPSLGAGASLVAAGLVAGAIFSGLLAFEGWPGSGGSGAAGAAVVLDDARGAVDSSTAASPVSFARSVPRAAVRPAAARGRAPQRAARPRVAAGRRSGGGVQRPPAAPAPLTRAPAPVRPVPAAPVRTRQPAAPAAAPAPSAPAPAPVPVPARPVTQVVDQVQRVVPPLPAPVQPTVDAVNGVLDDTATAVDGLLGGG